MLLNYTQLCRIEAEWISQLLLIIPKPLTAMFYFKIIARIINNINKPF